MNIHRLILTPKASFGKSMGPADFFAGDDAKQMRETKILKGLWPFVTSFQLFSNKVIIWQPKAPLAVLIEDKFIVEMLKGIFDKLWETA